MPLKCDQHTKSSDHLLPCKIITLLLTISLICGIKKQMNKQNKNRLVETEQTDGCQRGVRWKDG